MPRMNIIVGSTSPIKVNAVMLACQNIGWPGEVNISKIKTASEQNEQPVGFDETFAGALTRAKAAQAKEPESIAIGIESGIFLFHADASVILDIAVIVLLTPHGRQIVTTSTGIEFPEECVRIAEQRGFETTTVGSVVAERFGGDQADPHATLTKGRVTRQATLVEALTEALQQL